MSQQLICRSDHPTPECISRGRKFESTSQTAFCPECKAAHNREKKQQQKTQQQLAQQAQVKTQQQQLAQQQQQKALQQQQLAQQQQQKALQQQQLAQQQQQKALQQQQLAQQQQLKTQQQQQQQQQQQKALQQQQQQQKVDHLSKQNQQQLLQEQQQYLQQQLQRQLLLQQHQLLQQQGQQNPFLASPQQLQQKSQVPQHNSMQVPPHPMQQQIGQQQHDDQRPRTATSFTSGIAGYAKRHIVLVFDGGNFEHVFPQTKERTSKVFAALQGVLEYFDKQYPEHHVRAVWVQGSTDKYIKWLESRHQIPPETRNILIKEAQAKQNAFVKVTDNLKGNGTLRRLQVVEVGGMKSQSGLLAPDCKVRASVMVNSGADTRIAVETVRAYYDPKVDEVFMVSGDADLVPVFELCREMMYALNKSPLRLCVPTMNVCSPHYGSVLQGMDAVEFCAIPELCHLFPSSLTSPESSPVGAPPAVMRTPPVLIRSPNKAPNSSPQKDTRRPMQPKAQQSIPIPPKCIPFLTNIRVIHNKSLPPYTGLSVQGLPPPKRGPRGVEFSGISNTTQLATILAELQTNPQYNRGLKAYGSLMAVQSSQAPPGTVDIIPENKLFVVRPSRNQMKKKVIIFDVEVAVVFSSANGGSLLHGTIFSCKQRTVQEKPTTTTKSPNTLPNEINMMLRGHVNKYFYRMECKSALPGGLVLPANVQAVGYKDKPAIEPILDLETAQRLSQFPQMPKSDICRQIKVYALLIGKHNPQQPVNVGILPFKVFPVTNKKKEYLLFGPDEQSLERMQQSQALFPGSCTGTVVLGVLGVEPKLSHFMKIFLPISKISSTNRKKIRAAAQEAQLAPAQPTQPPQLQSVGQRFVDPQPVATPDRNEPNANDSESDSSDDDDDDTEDTQSTNNDLALDTEQLRQIEITGEDDDDDEEDQVHFTEQLPVVAYPKWVQDILSYNNIISNLFGSQTEEFAQFLLANATQYSKFDSLNESAREGLFRIIIDNYFA